MRVIGIYPGRFHPFHKGHAASFKQLAQKFGLDNTYLAISAKQEQPKSPFSAQDRAKMAMALGIPSKNIIAVRNPYAAQEYIDQLNLDPEKTAIVFGVSKKDMEGEPALGIPPDPRFSFKPKKDGSPAYLQPYGKDLVKPMDQHGYVMSTDVAEFPIAGKTMRDASAIRKAYAGADEKTKMRILKDLYGDAAEKMKQVFDNNLQVTESIRRLIDMIKPMLSEATVEQKAKFVELLSEAKTQLGEYNIRKTKKFIQRAHDKEQGQMYGSMPYSSHPKQVANLGKKFFGAKFGPEAVKVALLHDVLEDTPYTPEQLAKKGFSKEVIEAVQLLTKNKALSYADNIRNIINSGNPLAMMVKYCDNYMNFTGDKSHWTPERAAASQKKYLASLNMLGDVLGIKKHIGDEEVAEAIGNVVDRSYDMTDIDDKIDSEQRMKKLSNTMSYLQPREEYAIRARYGLDGEGEKTLQQLGDLLGVGTERARTILAKAERKLKHRSKPGYTPAPAKVKNYEIASEIEELKQQWKAIKDQERELNNDRDSYRIPSQIMPGAYSISPVWSAKLREVTAEKKKINAKIRELSDKLYTIKSAKMNETTGNYYSKGQADIIEDLGNGYFLGDDSYDDDEGFSKVGYTVYKQEGPDQYRMVASVNMSPYRNPEGHVENEIKKIIASDQNLSESADYLEEK